MKSCQVAALRLLLAVASICVFASPMAWAGTAGPLEGFADVSGVRLQFLDWGGSGQALIFLHDNGQNAHKFDDLAPAFTDRFHVIAYSRRGAGSSQANTPYDIATLTEDLRGLMDALGIQKANLVGHSFAGAEITQMAAAHPERVHRIVYLDAAYDFSESDYRAARAALPPWVFARPESAMSSFDAYRSYERTNWYGELDNMARVEAYLRQNVVIQTDERVKDRPLPEVNNAIISTFLASPRNYMRVRCPVLAIYADYVLAIHSQDPQHRHDALAWEEHYWHPFQAKSIDRIQREVTNVEIAHVPGRQVSFFLTHRPQVVQLMQQFLSHSK